MSDLNEEQFFIFVFGDFRRENWWRVAAAPQNVRDFVGHSSDIAAHNPIVVINAEDDCSPICVGESSGRFYKPQTICIQPLLEFNGLTFASQKELLNLRCEWLD